MSYWWVNHAAAAPEIADGYLWCAQQAGRGAGGGALTLPVPGDVVFSHAGGRVGALGVVLERVRSSPAPGGDAHRTAGWLLPVRFEPLPQPLVPKAHMALLRPVLPARRSPLRAGGAASATYLSAVPAAMVAVLAELLEGQIESLSAEVAIETDGQLTQAALEERIWQRADLTPGEKRELVGARTGRGSFRASVERIETACRVTGVLDRRHLLACHIKPWHACDDRERLDGFNGLLFSPHIEHLFSRGHITFMDNGELLISEHLNRLVRRAWGLARARKPQPFGPEQRQYLKFHRHQVFERLTGGRRR